MGRTKKAVARAAIGLGAVALVASAGMAPAAAGAKASLEVTVVDTTDGWEFQFDEPDAGKLAVLLDNQTDAPHEFAVLRLSEFGAAELEAAPDPIARLIEAADAEDDAFVDKFAGGAFAPPQSDGAGKLKAKAPGTYAYFCFIGAPELPHYKAGLIGTFEIE